MAKEYAPDDISQLHKNARKQVESELRPGETVRVVVPGRWDWAIIGTDRRAFVFKKGLQAGATFGTKFNSWEYMNISGIQMTTGIFGGHIAIQAAGVNEKDDDEKAPHTIAILRQNFDMAKERVALLRQLISERSAPQSAAVVQSPIEQLKSLAELRDAGVISEAEFEDKKKSLIERI